MANDVIDIEVLPDGTIKMSTDKISMANHVNAEGFIRAITAEAGGGVERRRKGRSVYEVEHEHEHEGHTHTH